MTTPLAVQPVTHRQHAATREHSGPPTESGPVEALYPELRGTGAPLVVVEE